MSFFSEVRLEDEFGPFVAFQEALGFVPNLVRAQTLLPRVVEAQAKLERAVRLQEGAIPRIQKERILLSIAADRHDAYCVALDAKVLSSLGVSDGEVHDLLNDSQKADLSASDLSLAAILSQTKPRTLLRYARKTSKRCGHADSGTSRYSKPSS